MRYIAPAGTKITFSDLTYAFINLIKSKDVLEDFRKAICEKFDVKYCFFWGTGRTGMAFLLKALCDLDKRKRNEVIIPSYTCYSVPASIEYAGLKVRICDIDLNTLDYDHEKLNNQNFQNVLAIISANLFGIPNNLSKLERLAKEKNVYFIDDAAQAMEAQFENRFVGTFGDAGLFSLDKGKNITTINGGITITNSDEIAEKLKSYQLALNKVNVLNKTILGFKFIIYAIMLKPVFYWIPNSLPFLKLGITIYDKNMPLSKYTELQAALAFQLLKKLRSISDNRVKNASEIFEHLKTIEKIELPFISANSKPVFLRFPLLVNYLERSKILTYLNTNRIGATGSYPQSVFEIPETQSLLNKQCSYGENGKVVAKQIITIPTNEYVKKKDKEKIYSVFHEYYKN